MVTQNVLRTCKEKQVYSEMNFNFPTALARNKCLKQIKLPISLHTCAPISELAINISTIVEIMIIKASN